jgi:hypothetical protein
MNARKPTAPRSGILYSGPSLIDGSPIVVVALYRTTGANAKTGAMVQTYILRADQSPMDAIRTGADVSICGDCKHRGDGMTYGSRSCYVNIGQGPTGVFKAYQRGRYATLDTDARIAMGRGRTVRLGTYGDPAAVPVAIWLDLTCQSIGHTGYTHAWRLPVAAPLRTLVMASADTLDERTAAAAAGWRTFRVRAADEPIAAGEFVCPASAEAGRRKTCIDCTACDGADPLRASKASPVIIAHGALASRLASNRARIIPIAQA